MFYLFLILKLFLIHFSFILVIYFSHLFLILYFFVISYFDEKIDKQLLKQKHKNQKTPKTKTLGSRACNLTVALK